MSDSHIAALLHVVAQPEEVMLQLVNSNCIPALLYCLEDWPVL